MNEQQTERLLGLLGSIAASLERLAGQQDGDQAPDLVFPIEEYAGFDWAGLGAQVITRDTGGPAVVMWGGKNFKRRAPDNAFDPAIWFSHCVGKTEDGRNEYVRLVTFRKFKDDDVQPIGRKAERYAQAAPASPAPVQPQNAPQGVVAGVTEQPRPNMANDAERMFDGLPSASAGRPPLQPTARPAGPQVSAGARPATDPELCPVCGKPWAKANELCPKHQAPVIRPANGKAETGRVSQATLGVGRVGGEFRNWASEFAKQHPRYRINGRSEDVDMYHILKTVGSFGIARIEMDNLAEVCARLETHAAAA